MRCAESWSKSWPQTLLLAVTKRLSGRLNPEARIDSPTWVQRYVPFLFLLLPISSTQGKIWGLAQPFLAVLINGLDFLQGFIGNKMHLPSAIITEYSESAGDIFPIFLTLDSDVWSLYSQVRKFLLSSLSPTREKSVPRSMTEEQTPLSQNSRGHSSFFTISQTHCWLWP